MAKIAASDERVFHAAAEPEAVYAFFSAPDRLRRAMSGVRACEALPGNRVHWLLEEKVDKGIRFQPDFVVAYQGDGVGHMSCRFVEGNMRNDWDVWIKPAAGGSEIRYRESIEPDLPITPITALLIKPLVARELRREISLFLDNVQQELSGAAA